MNRLPNWLSTSTREEAPVCAPSAPPKPPRFPGNPPNIAGWLILPALGVFFSPLFTLGVGGQVRIAVYELRQTGRLSVFPHAEAFETFAVTSAVLFALIQLIAALFFFRKRRFVPRMMTGLYVAAVAYGLVMLYASASVFRVPVTGESLTSWSLSLSWAVVWMMYFQVSERVKATFVR